MYFWIRPVDVVQIVNLFAGCAFKQLAFVVGGGRLVLGRSSGVGASLEGLDLITATGRYGLGSIRSIG